MTRHHVSSHFTLLELIAVMVVIAIILGITIPAVSRLMTGSGVEAAARIVAANARLARQYAISKRCRVALLLPANEGSVEDRRFSSVRLCIVDDDDHFEEWMPDSKWEFFPTGGVVVEVDDTAGYGGADKTQTVTGLSTQDFGGAGTCRAVVFKTNGRIADGARFIHIVEGGYGSGNTPIIKAKSNHVDVELDQYTGRVTFLWPEDK